MTNSDSNYVYLINAVKTDKFKIGVTVNIKKRIADMQTSCPYRLRLVHACYSSQAYEVEKQLHERFAKQRVILEWFEFTTNEVKAVIELLNLCHDPLEFSRVITDRIGEHYINTLLAKPPEVNYEVEFCCPECCSTDVSKNGWHDVGKTVRRYKCKRCGNNFKS